MAKINTKKLDLIKTVQETFKPTCGQELMQHLKTFCYGQETSFKPDPYLTAFNEGMRFVYVYLNNMLEKPLESQLQTSEPYRNPFEED